MKTMTKQSRLIIYLSLFISGALIFPTLVYFFGARETTDGDITWRLIAIIFIAILAAVVVYVARKKIKTRAKLLNTEFFIAYESIGDSMEGSVLSIFERKETMKDILGLFIDAQNSGRTVEQVTGGGLSGFIIQVQDSFGYRNRLLFTLIAGVQYAIMYLFVVQIYEWVRNTRGESFFSAQPGYSLIVLLLPIAFIGIPLMRYFIRKQKIFWAIAVLFINLAVGIAFMEITYANFMHIEWIRSIHEDVFSYVPGWGFLVLWLGIFTASFGFMWLIRRISIKKL